MHQQSGINDSTSKRLLKHVGTLTHYLLHAKFT